MVVGEVLDMLDINAFTPSDSALVLIDHQPFISTRSSCLGMAVEYVMAQLESGRVAMPAGK